MDLLALARGPFFYLALAVFVIGTAWRLLALWSRPAMGSLAPAKSQAVAGPALATLLKRSLPRAGLRPSSTLVTVNPYVFHIGLAVIALGYAPHVEFLRRVFGVGWPALPDPVMYVAAGLTIPSLILALIFRRTDPALRLVSGLDDYLSWFVTFAPLVTGMAVISGPSGAASPGGTPLYPGPLTLHLLSVELLLIWFPFGKLMHALLVFPGRMQLGAMLARRGVRP